MLGDLLAASSCVEQDGSNGSLTGFCDDLVRNFTDGHLKLWTTTATLRFRRDHATFFQDGSYRPLHAEGEKVEHLVAFSREHESKRTITAVPRLPYTLCGGHAEKRIADCWGDTRLIVPAGRYRNVFTSELLETSGALPCEALFAHYPVALLEGV